MTVVHIAQWQREIGVVADGDFGPKTLARSMDVLKASRGEATIPDTEENQSMRALKWCMTEAAKWGARQVPAERVADYFRGCVRAGANIGDWLAGEELAGRRKSFCAAAQGYAERQVWVSGETRSPWRAGALEIYRDALNGDRPGQRWMTISECLSRGSWPHPGSLAVYENTKVSGSGHVERVIFADESGYRSVGANEQNKRWIVDVNPVTYFNASRADGMQTLRLLGFVVNTRQMEVAA